MRVKACVGKVAGAGTLALAGAIHAGGLFLPGDGVGAAGDVVHGVKSAAAPPSMAGLPRAWERSVRIARQELAVARGDVHNFGSGRLLLNVREGVDLDVVVERTAPTKWGYSLSGRVAGGNVGFVTLVVHDEVVAGSIWTPDSSYELHYMGSGIHALWDVTDAPPIACGGALPLELSAADENVQASTDDHRGDDVSVVDILVVWTQAAEELHGGGEQGMLALSDMLVAYVNDVFGRSGALVSLNLVGAGMAVEGGFEPERRDALGADLVHELRGRGPGPSGMAALRGSVGWTKVGGSTASIFAHEIGHNFGIYHDRSGRGPAGPQYFHNAFTTAAGEDCMATAVSQAVECSGRPATTPPFYASPWRYHPSDGRPLGVSRFARDRGARGPADAVLTINRNRHVLAAFRPRRDGS